MDVGGESGRGPSASPSPVLVRWHRGLSAAALQADEIRAWLVDLDAGLGPDEIELAEPSPADLDLLDEIERARAARFVRAHDRRRFANCRAALRSILGLLLEQSPRAVRIQAGGQGKPELFFEKSGPARNETRAALRFNVSHSSDRALIGVCHGRELGVDLERARHISEAERIVASFFSPAEQIEFTAIPDSERTQAFFRGWTRKEAVLKGLGVGLAGLAAQYETGFGTGNLSASFTPATPAPRVNEWELWEAAPCPGFLAAIAVYVPASDQRHILK